MRDLHPVVEALAAAEDEGPVGEILLEHEVTAAEFRELDQHPGRWGYKVGGREWHWKLRRWRNHREGIR